MGERRIDQGHPQDRKEDERTELHAFRNGSADQSHRNPGKHELKHHESQVRDGRARKGLRPDAIRPQKLETADIAKIHDKNGLLASR